jgi:hypothetical protein
MKTLQELKNLCQRDKDQEVLSRLKLRRSHGLTFIDSKWLNLQVQGVYCDWYKERAIEEKEEELDLDSVSIITWNFPHSRDKKLLVHKVSIYDSPDLIKLLLIGQHALVRTDLHRDTEGTQQWFWSEITPLTREKSCRIALDTNCKTISRVNPFVQLFGGADNE